MLNNDTICAFQSQLDIILDDVECSEPTGNFADVCSFRTLHNCGHSEDIYLSCGEHLQQFLQISVFLST